VSDLKTFPNSLFFKNYGYDSPKQALETKSAAELRGTDPARGGIQLTNFNALRF